MLHARRDYDGIIDMRAAPIPDDEPVLLLRGQDVCAPAALAAYADALMDHGADKEMVDAVLTQADRMLAWQRDVKSKTPDVDKAVLR